MLRFLRMRWRLGLLLALIAGGAIFFLARWRAASSSLAPVKFIQAQGEIDGLRFSHDGRFVVTSDRQDHLVTFYDASTGQIVRQWPGGGSDLWLSEDDERVLTADPSIGGPTQCVLYDAVTGRVLRQWTGRILDVLPNFSLMVTADDYSRAPDVDTKSSASRISKMVPPSFPARLVEVSSGRVVGEFAQQDPLGVRLSHDGRFVSIPGWGKPAQLLRAPEMTSLLSLPPLPVLRVSYDGSRAFGAARDGVLRAWDLPSGRQSAIATGFAQIYNVYPRSDGSVIVEGLQGTFPHSCNMIQVRSADGARLLRSLPFQLSEASYDGRFLSSGQSYGQGRLNYDVLDIQTGRRVAHLDMNADPLGQPVLQNISGIGLFAIAPNGRRFAYASQGGLLHFYDVSSPAPHLSHLPVLSDSGQTILSFKKNNYESGVFDAVTLPGGGIAAIGGLDNQRLVKIWRPDKDIVAVNAAVGNGNVDRLGVSLDGKMLVGSSNWGVWTMDLASGRMMDTPIRTSADGTQSYPLQPPGSPVWLDGPRQPFSVLSTNAFGDGMVLLTHWDASGRRTDVQTILSPEQTMGNSQYQITQAQVSPGGAVMAVLWSGISHGTENGQPTKAITGDGRLDLRDTRTGRFIRMFVSARENPLLLSLGKPAFSLDGKLLAIADERGVILVFDVASGRKICQMSGSRALNTGVTMGFAGDTLSHGAILAFAPGNQFLAAARDDGSIYLYSLKTFLPVAQIGKADVLPSPSYWEITRPLQWISFDARGDRVYGFAQNGDEVRAWDVPKLP